MPGSGPVGDLPSAPPDEFKQRLRMRRFLLASLFSVLYLLVLAIFSMQNRVDRTTLIEACVLVGALILAFWLVFRSGLNLRFADPGLTGWQLAGRRPPSCCSSSTAAPIPGSRSPRSSSWR